MENVLDYSDGTNWYVDIFKNIYSKTGIVEHLSTIFCGSFEKYADKHIKVDKLINNLSEEEKFQVKNRIFNYIINNKDSINNFELEYVYGNTSNAYILKDNIGGDYYVFYTENNVPYVASFDSDSKDKAIRFASQNYFITQG